MKSETSSPVITFALPRSGSTLLIRLLNRCKNSANQPISYNGECDAISDFIHMFQKVESQDDWGVKSKKELEEDKEFLSHYHAQKTDLALAYLRDFWRNYCEGEANHSWGWKMVNYGIFPHNFSWLNNQIIKVWPDVKFIILLRDKESVLKSMKTTDFDWDLGHNMTNQKRIVRQNISYQNLLNEHSSRCFLLKYEDILNYETFSKFLSHFDWSIPAPLYEQIINSKRRDDVGTNTEKIINSKK